jgi:hypothetical protein
MKKKEFLFIKKQLSARQEVFLLKQKLFVLESSISTDLTATNTITTFKTTKLLKQTFFFKLFGLEKKFLNSFIYFQNFTCITILTNYIKVLTIKCLFNKNKQIIFIKVNSLFFRSFVSYDAYTFPAFVLFIKLKKISAGNKRFL